MSSSIERERIARIDPYRDRNNCAKERTDTGVEDRRSVSQRKTKKKKEKISSGVGQIATKENRQELR